MLYLIVINEILLKSSFKQLQIHAFGKVNNMRSNSGFHISFLINESAPKEGEQVNSAKSSHEI